MTPEDLANRKAAGRPIVMVTAYDHPSALVVEEAGVDVVLVGDSAATTVLGFDSTVPVGVTELLVLGAAVRRGLRTPLLVADLPFGSYESSDQQAIETAVRFRKETGCDAVKLEGSPDRVSAVVRAGIPVMGHIGLTPQTAGDHRARGRSASAALALLDEALALAEAGCFALVIEAVPAEVTALLMPHLDLPVIGIGAGPATDGQVLVFHDLLGILPGRKPRFVETFADVRERMLDGVSRFAAGVRSRTYPAPEHCYPVDPDELADLRRLLSDRPRPPA